ncbi:hypothetical protein [Phenylobacterium sp.]|uniref:hypothetical protein n=1 Tax=Phenylobacterium sp. TaxID=1871053 RepID=UPI002811A918|nr:hypothetical protein [Phenylobacterium sp.]
MAPRLKVFVTSDGLTDYVVATTSKVKALAAWGSHQDLFKTGLAREADDPELIKAATARPDEVLRRPAGTRGELAKLKPAKKAAPKKPAGPSKAALKKVADLEKRLAAAEAAHAQALEELERKRQTLETKGAAELARLQDQLNAAKRALGS